MPTVADTAPAQPDPLLVYLASEQDKSCAFKTLDLVTGAEAVLKGLAREYCDGGRYFSEKTGDLAVVEGSKLEIIGVRSGKDTLPPVGLPDPPLDDLADIKNHYAYLDFAGMGDAGKPVASYPDTETGNGEACMLYAYDGQGWSLVKDTDCKTAQYGFVLREGSDKHLPWALDTHAPWFASSTDKRIRYCDSDDTGDAVIRSDTVFRFDTGVSHLKVDRAYGCGADDPIAAPGRVALTPASDPHERVLETAVCDPEVYGRYLMVMCNSRPSRVYDLESGRVLFDQATAEMVIVP